MPIRYGRGGSARLRMDLHGPHSASSSSSSYERPSPASETGQAMSRLPGGCLLNSWGQLLQLLVGKGEGWWADRTVARSLHLSTRRRAGRGCGRGKTLALEGKGAASEQVHAPCGVIYCVLTIPTEYETRVPPEWRPVHAPCARCRGSAADPVRGGGRNLSEI